LNETLLPIFKRRVLGYINQSLSIKYDKVWKKKLHMN
jgi:hypothetical protein